MKWENKLTGHRGDWGKTGSLTSSKIVCRLVIVYYAPTEEKTWTVHSSCKLPPEPKARVANTNCGLTNFIPVVRILFFAKPGSKTPHS